VPTLNLPINQGWRNIGLGFVADALDTIQRPMIDAAYTNRPRPTAAQLAASTSEQAKIPSPVQIPGPPEPVAMFNPPRTESVLASSAQPSSSPAPAEVATNVVTQPVSHPTPTSESRPSGDQAGHHEASRGHEPHGRQAIAAPGGVSGFRCKWPDAPV
jgi:hypothetical protein